MLPNVKQKNKIDLGNNAFDYLGKKFSFIKVDDNFYFKGKEIAEFLEYINTKQALIDHVDEDDKITLGNLLSCSNFESANLADSKLGKNEGKFIYIMESGLYSLVLSSHKKEAKEFKKFVTKEVIPTLRKTGTFSLKLNLILDTSSIKSFYKDNDISDFIDKFVCYLGVIRFYNGKLLVKWGYSERLFKRDFLEHKKTFGEQFKMYFAIETDNCKKVEELFKQSIISMGLHEKLQFCGNQRAKLFTTNDDFSLDDAVELMKKTTKNTPLKSLKDRDDIIEKLQYKQENDILIEKEKTKQEEAKKTRKKAK